MKDKNVELRKLIKDNELLHRDVAKMTGMSMGAVNSWLRHDNHYQNKAPASAIYAIKYHLGKDKDK